MTKDEMVGCIIDSMDFEQTPGDSEGQGSLVSPSPRGPKVSDMTEQLNSNIQIWSYTDEFLLTRIIGTLHKTSSTVFASHLLLSMHILLALSTLSLLRKKEVWRRRGTLVALSFPSSHCLQPKCWANTGKELEYQRM